jgi:hypothetical protein
MLVHSTTQSIDSGVWKWRCASQRLAAVSLRVFQRGFRCAQVIVSIGDNVVQGLTSSSTATATACHALISFAA